MTTTRDGINATSLGEVNDILARHEASLNGGYLPLIDVVQEFGAKGNSTGVPGTGTDDTAAIQAAINEGVAYLPPNRNGTKRYYRITSNLIVPDHAGLVGPGESFVELVPDFAVAGTPNNVITNSGAATVGNVDITLYGFSLLRSVAGNIQHGILLNGVDGLFSDRIRVYGTPQANAGCFAVSGILPSGAASRLLSQRVKIGTLDLRDTTNFGLQLSWVSGAVVDQILASNAYREILGIEPEPGCLAENISVGRIVATGAATAGGTATGMVIVTDSSGGTVGDGISFGQIVVDGGATPIASDASPGVFIRGVQNGLEIDQIFVRRANGPGVLIGSAGATTKGVLLGRVTALNCNQGGNASPSSVGLGFRAATDCAWGEAYISGAAHTASVEETSSAARISHGRLRGTDTKRFNGIAVTSTINEDLAAVAAFAGAGVAVSPDLGTGCFLSVTVTDATAFTINSPTNHTQGRVFTYEIINTSGGAMGTITWGAQYKLAGAFTNPATGKRRTITFCDDGTNCVEIGRAAADI